MQKNAESTQLSAFSSVSDLERPNRTNRNGTSVHSSATGIIGSEGTALRTTLESEELKYRKGYRKNRNTSSGEAPVICSSTITTSEIATPMAAEAKFPIAVLDQDGGLRGIVTKAAVLSSMI